MASKYHVHSISLPSSSRPTALRIEEQLNKLKTWESTTFTSKHVSIRLCLGLTLLEDLYTCLDDLLNLCSTQQLISYNEVKKSIEELLDGSLLNILDIYGLTRDIMPQIKQNVQSLHSVLRRRKGDSSIERSVKKYAFLTKKMKEDANMLIIDLKILHSKFGVTPLLNECAHHLSSLVRVLSGAILMKIFVFKSLVSFLAMLAARLKATRWSAAMRLMHKGFIGLEENSENVNELKCVESELNVLLGEGVEHNNPNSVLNHHFFPLQGLKFRLWKGESRYNLYKLCFSITFDT